MNQRMDEYALLRDAGGMNAMREHVEDWQTAGIIHAAISTGGGSLQAVNELLRVESTHTAVTGDAVAIGERLRAEDGTEYLCTYAIPGERRRLNLLYLKAVTAP